jgi:hypothetical protein
MRHQTNRALCWEHFAKPIETPERAEPEFLPIESTPVCTKRHDSFFKTPETVLNFVRLSQRRNKFYLFNYDFAAAMTHTRCRELAARLPKPQRGQQPADEMAVLGRLTEGDLKRLLLANPRVLMPTQPRHLRASTRTARRGR